MAVTTAWKVTMIFGAGKWGWTETYYWGGNSANYSGAYIAATLLVQRRVQFLGQGSSMEAVRFSDVNNSGSGRLVPWGQYGLSPNAGLPCAFPAQSLLVSVAAGPVDGLQYRRSVTLRGIPNVWYTFDIAQPLNPTFVPLFLSRLTAFLSLLQDQNNPSGAWSVRASDRDRIANPSYRANLVRLQQPGGYFIVGFDPVQAPTWGIGTRVHIGKAKGPGTRGLNADATVLGFDALGGFILSSRQKCPSQTATLTSVARGYKKDIIYVPIRSAVPERFLKRDTGRPFFGTRGRQSGSTC